MERNNDKKPRPDPVDLFQKDQKVLDGLADHFRYFARDDRTEDYHLRYIVKSIKAPENGIDVVDYLVNYFSSINMSLFERKGHGKLAGHDVEFQVTVVINTAELLDINWMFKKQNEFLTIWNPQIGKYDTMMFSNGKDRLVILKFTNSNVEKYLNGN